MTYTLTSADNEVVISSFGGQILSWTKKGVPIIFENREHAIVDGKTAYRGGSPICFPYFSRGNLLPLGITLNPQHGQARTSIWDAEVVGSDNAIVLTNTQPTGEGYGPTDLWCELVYRLDESLHIRATVRNIGAHEAPFQLAVHSYWATAEPSKAIVRGLGNRYLDNLLGLTEHSETDSSQPHLPPVDRVYLDAASDQQLKTDQYHLKISTQGCSAAVLWNPGKDHNLKDLGSPDFICLESGVIAPAKVLAPGQEHVVEISYEVELI